jgi:membrane protein implicated in regulation of membrane protease activity
VIGEILEIVGGALVLVAAGSIATVLLARRYALRVSATHEREARLRGKKG